MVIKAYSTHAEAKAHGTPAAAEIDGVNCWLLAGVIEPLNAEVTTYARHSDNHTRTVSFGECHGLYVVRTDASNRDDQIFIKASRFEWRGRQLHRDVLARYDDSEVWYRE